MKLIYEYEPKNGPLRQGSTELPSDYEEWTIEDGRSFIDAHVIVPVESYGGTVKSMWLETSPNFKVSADSLSDFLSKETRPAWVTPTLSLLAFVLVLLIVFGVVL